MKLTVDTLDNDVKSAVIDIGKDIGYVEVFVDRSIMHLNVFNKEGLIVHEWAATTKYLRSSYDNEDRYTMPLFASTEFRYEKI